MFLLWIIARVNLTLDPTMAGFLLAVLLGKTNEKKYGMSRKSRFLGIGKLPPRLFNFQ